MRLVRTLRRPLWLVLVLGGALALLGWSMPGAHADNKNSGASRYGACLAAQKSGELLLLFDESGSLQSSDPKAARVTAAKYLVQTLGKYADRVGADVDVAIAGFSDSYAVHQNWTKLTAATADSLDGQLDAQAPRNTGIDTDYWVALDGARQTLASRGSGPNGADRCQAIAFFSDGKIDFTQRPLTKPYADGTNLNSQDGVDQTVRKATESICRPGGLADQRAPATSSCSRLGSTKTAHPAISTPCRQSPRAPVSPVCHAAASPSRRPATSIRCRTSTTCCSRSTASIPTPASPSRARSATCRSARRHATTSCWTAPSSR